MEVRRLLIWVHTGYALQSPAAHKKKRNVKWRSNICVIQCYLCVIKTSRTAYNQGNHPTHIRFIRDMDIEIVNHISYRAR